MRHKPDYANAYINLGVIYNNRHEPLLAVTAYRKALSYEPDSVTALYNLGVVMVKTGDIQGAIGMQRRLFALAAGGVASFVIGDWAPLLAGGGLLLVPQFTLAATAGTWTGSGPARSGSCSSRSSCCRP